MSAEGEAAFQAAHQAAEGVRALNHATLGLGLTAPEVSSAVAQLAAMLDMMPQAFEQLARHLEQRRAEGVIRMDDGSDLDTEARAAINRLNEAAVICEAANRVSWGDPAGLLSAVVHDAASRLFHMGHQDPALIAEIRRQPNA